MVLLTAVPVPRRGGRTGMPVLELREARPGPAPGGEAPGRPRVFGVCLTLDAPLGPRAPREANGPVRRGPPCLTPETCVGHWLSSGTKETRPG